MDKYKLIATLIIAMALMLCLAAGAVITHLLLLLHSPWNLIANGLFALAMLTLGAYPWINKLKKGNNGED